MEVGSERVRAVVEVEPVGVQLVPGQSVWASAGAAAGLVGASSSQPEAEHPPCAQSLSWGSCRALGHQCELLVLGQEVDGGRVPLQGV